MRKEAQLRRAFVNHGGINCVADHLKYSNSPVLLHFIVGTCVCVFECTCHELNVEVRGSLWEPGLS